MKNVAPALVGKKDQKKGIKAFFLGQKALQRHFHGRHKRESIGVLWIEASQFSKIRCFPCVIEEEEKTWVYRTLSSFDSEQKNNDMLARWNEIMNPETFFEDWDYAEIEQKEFHRLYSDFQKNIIQKEIAELEALDAEEDRMREEAEQAALESGDDEEYEEETEEEETEEEPAKRGLFGRKKK